MRLLTFIDPHDGDLRFGLSASIGIIDVASAADALDVSNVPTRIEAAISGGPHAREALRQLLMAAERKAANAPAPWLHRESSLNWGPAVPHPGKIVCIGLNYRQHAAESNMKIPDAPVLFSKFNNAITGNGAVIPLPPDGEQFDYEAELAIVIGTRARTVAAAAALDHVFGYCNANDFSCRDLQFRSGQWLLGKCFDGWCPVGPHLVTADEVENPNQLAVRCYVNGDLRQDGNSSDMIFPCAELIAYVSRYLTLEPGDIILTGTPAGVALGRPDKPWLKIGDEVVVEVEGLGRLKNVVGERR